MEIEALALSVLIVDDEVELRRRLVALVGEALRDATIVEADDGFRAVEACQQSHFDIVVMDVRMPRMSGFETMRRLKAAHPSLPVVLMSVVSAEDYEQLALRAGAAAYLPKDRVVTDLVSVIVASAVAQ